MGVCEERIKNESGMRMFSKVGPACSLQKVE